MDGAAVFARPRFRVEEAAIGPYELQDFNLFYLSRYGLKPSKILFLAWHAWREKYDYATLRKWL